MSLFRSTLRPPPTSSDEAVRRYLLTVRAGIEPDPLFRRRLRGLVVNRHVAVREGLERPAVTRSGARAMGALGRACLYASVAIAASVGGTMAASQGALPGDAIYPLKRQVEALRLQALPVTFHDDLAVYTLSERIHEMTRLVEAGDTAAAAALVPAVEAGYARLVELGVGTERSEVLEARMVVLDALHERLPASAQAAIEQAMERATKPVVDASQPDAARPRPETNPHGRPATAPSRTEQQPGDQRGQADEKVANPPESPPAHDRSRQVDASQPVE